MAYIDSTLDVYATPYVPQKLRQVNTVPATAVPCLPAPGINFPSYIQTFAGRDLLPRNRQAPTNPQSPDLEILGMHNYSPYFTNALTYERNAIQKECDEYALYQVQLIPAYGDPRQFIYQLLVPGLSESSLRIEVGDVVHIRQLRFNSAGEVIFGSQFHDHFGRQVVLPNPIDQRHDAVVWGIDRLRETLSLRIDALKPGSQLFNACFTHQFSRFTALQNAVIHAQCLLQDNDWIRSMLFPEFQDGKLQYVLNTALLGADTWDQELNFEQLRAVRSIVDGGYGRVPFLITGPPGTGKTKTVVETTLQLVACEDVVRLLLCAPSDAAADMLLQRLRKWFTPLEILRLNAPGRSFPEVPNDVLPFCYVDGEIFSLPPFADLMKKKVVVATCRDAEILRRARVSNIDLYDIERNLFSALHPNDSSVDPPLHWTGVIIDEAAQATEPEALIPLLVVAPPREAIKNNALLPLVVMVGDHNQLGPRTAFKDTVIQRSLFERLLFRPLYSQHPLTRSKQAGGTVRPLTKEMLPIIRPPFTDLIRNYRSHAAILTIPSSLFYNDTLEPCAKHTQSLLSWSHFSTSIPVLFVDNQSPDEIEQDGGGWFNVGEAEKALVYAKSLLDESLLQQEEICIMSPFQAQAKVLRSKARARDLRYINIGPLEAFQGLESRMVIICTTRSRGRFIDQDIARGLGIIHESRRFNVAMTRAKEGLVVIGNPSILIEDENWASFIAFCHRNKAWSGELGELHLPHSSKIKTSRLEKQLEYRKKVDTQDREVNGITRRICGLTFGMSEDEAFYESGISAESAVRNDKKQE